MAPLWVAFEANLGTLLRTCDAVGACIAVPDTEHYRDALRQGDTLGPRRRPCVHWIRTGKDRWIAEQRTSGSMIVAVELAEAADVCVEIPMIGQGASLNVAVAGSLVLYRLAGMA